MPPLPLFQFCVPRNDARPIHDFTCELLPRLHRAGKGALTSERRWRQQVKPKTSIEGSVLREVAATTMKRSTILSGYAEALPAAGRNLMPQAQTF